MEERAQALKIEVAVLAVRSVEDVTAALGASRKPVDALVVPDDGLFIANARLVAALAGTARLPAIGFREFCEAGGLLAYGVNLAHIWRESATLVDKVLRGAKAADIIRADREPPGREGARRGGSPILPHPGGRRPRVSGTYPAGAPAS